MRPAVIAFMAIWFGYALIGGGSLMIGAIGSLVRGHATAHAWISVATVAFMLSGGVAGVVLRFACFNEPWFLIHFLRDTIAAQEA
jgi:hypothetical protein